MKLDARSGRCERQATDDPSLVQQWVAMMTALIAFEEERADVTPETTKAVRAQAREYVRRGVPATIGDWFRGLHTLAGAEGVRA